MRAGQLALALLPSIAAPAAHGADGPRIPLNQAASDNELLRWGYFSEAFRSGFVRVDVFEASDKDRYWVLKRSTADATIDHKGTDWADSRRCPALTQSMDQLGTIEAPVFATPANLANLRAHGPDNGQVSVVNDPNVYELDFQGFYKTTGGAQANISILAYDDSPLAGWIHDTLDRLASCWSSTEVK